MSKVNVYMHFFGMMHRNYIEFQNMLTLSKTLKVGKIL